MAAVLRSLLQANLEIGQNGKFGHIFDEEIF